MNVGTGTRDRVHNGKGQLLRIHHWFFCILPQIARWTPFMRTGFVANTVWKEECIGLRSFPGRYSWCGHCIYFGSVHRFRWNGGHVIGFLQFGRCRWLSCWQFRFGIPSLFVLFPVSLFFGRHVWRLT